LKLAQTLEKKADIIGEYKLHEGFLALLVFTIPTFSILIPGLVSEWIKVIPSYYLVDTVYQAANFDVSWGDMGPNLLILLAFAVVFFALGIVILRRKFQ
jgi:ABC-2 type transport system permease protein